MFDIAPDVQSEFVLRGSAPSQLPKKMTVIGPFGKSATLIECQTLTTTAAYGRGESFVITRNQLEKHYGCHF